MTGVPAAGLPKMTRTVSRSSRPTARAASVAATGKTVISPARGPAATAASIMLMPPERVDGRRYPRGQAAQ